MADLAPSLLAADFSSLKDEISILNEEKVNYLHLDVMDGNYVPNITFGPGLIKSLRDKTDMIFDVHLMIEKPERFIEDFVKAGADMITFHVEATTHPHRVIQQIKSFGIKAGVALNPGTSLKDIEYLLDDVDMILIMSVNPGFGGQSFIESSKTKISKLRKIIDEENKDIIIQVDGGVKTNNLQEIKDLGVDLVVSGSDIFCKDIREKISFYKKVLN
ncbi:MAG: ribulose-phosphate 3-epimerase [Tissierellia bacterium]|nr:ribulose-phosphate 3-epimerase [Tissierellia bacterium]